MKDRLQHGNRANLDFHSVYSEDSGLQFDCVTGNDVSHRFPVHIHNSLCAGLVTKGKRNIVWSDSSSVINRNELFVINENQPHAIFQTDPHDYIAITVKGRSERVAFENVIRSRSCVGLFMELFDTLREGRVDELSEKWNDLYGRLVETHRLSDAVSPDETFLRRSLKYIRDNYQRQISVADIAAHACVSTYHFCRLFKRLTGLSPHNYLKQYRLSRSYERLRNNIPVFDTAIETGFYDSSHFVKTFHSYMAVSPREYQISVRK